MREAKYDNVLDMFTDLERGGAHLSNKDSDTNQLRVQRRESAYNAKGKDMSVHTRQLSEKFILLLDLVFRSLFELGVGGEYSQETLLKYVHRVDNSM